MLKLLGDYWWVLALRGLAAVLFGIAALVWPELTLVALVALFGIYAIADGVLSIIVGFRQTETHERWWLFLLEGLVGIAAGIIALVLPDVTLLALTYLAAAWALITGIFEIIAAIRLRREIEGEWLMVLTGIASIGLGVLLILLPGPALTAFIWIVGIYAIIFGLLLIFLAFRIRSASRQIDTRLDERAGQA